MKIVSEPKQPEKVKHKPHVPQPIEAADNPDALLRITTAAALIGGGHSSVYNRAANDPTFPALIKLGARCTRIRAGDLTDWLKAQAAKAPATPAPVVVSITPLVKRGPGRPRKEVA